MPIEITSGMPEFFVKFPLVTLGFELPGVSYICLRKPDTIFYIQKVLSVSFLH